MHHVIVGVYDPKLPRAERMIAASSPSLGAYVPGNGPTLYPQDTGVLVRKDQSFAFQMHYTTSGKAAHDVTRFGLYFRDSAPTYEFKTVALANPKIKIPPNTKEHAETIAQEFPRDSDHLPADAARALPRPRLAVRRDLSGRHARRLLLSVPKYDFNWQTTYTLATPKQVPAGTKIVHTHGLRQLGAEPGEPGSEPDGAVGRAVVRRDAVRRRAVPRADAGRRDAGAGVVGRAEVSQPDRRKRPAAQLLAAFSSSLAFISTFMNRLPVASSRVRSIQRRPTTAGIQNPGVMLVR